jgi:transcriptional regulator with XRE-family HTH domain
MSNPTQNNGPDNNLPGGPPMVKIAGATVRRIREESGLTQLYVATVVQVTTETISRWENRRYPSIKKENAEKLAEALGVELTTLLEREEQTPTPEGSGPEPVGAEPESSPTLPPAPFRAPGRRRAWRLTLILLVAAALSAAAWYLLAGHPEPLPVTATRVLPAHVPPGQDFPVLLKVSSPPPASFALIIRENLPAGCRLTGASPAATGPIGRAGQITWVSRLEGGERLFAYRLSSPTRARLGTDLRFQGQVVAGGRGETTTSITGSAQLTIAPYHWADLNGDNRIDDEEILWVYDLFGTLEGFDDLRDEVDRIWTAGGYRWDAAAGHYQAVK